MSAKTFVGIVVSNSMNKTVVVEISRRIPHPIYRKLLKQTKKLKADPGEFEIAVGDMVKIQETKPLSKTKNFKVIQKVKEAVK